MPSSWINKYILNFRIAGILLFALTLFLFIKVYVSSTSYQGPCGPLSNYKVFSSAHQHLFTDHDLYNYHPAEHCYTFKYSPTYALFFGLISRLPAWLGVFTWTFISALLTFFTIRALPAFKSNQKAGFIFFILFEYWVSVQSLQTNVIVACMLILAWIKLEKEKYALATLLIISTGFIKIFGFGAVILFLFYPKKPKLVIYSIFWTILLFFLPIVIVPWHELKTIYENWWIQISGDYNNFIGMSVYSLLNTTTGILIGKSWIMMASLLVMSGVFIQYRKWTDPTFRLLCLATLLIWFVVFNHKSESATYIIAMFGIAIWYFYRSRKWFDHLLMVFTLIVISILFSDLAPKFLKNEVGFKYHLKALPAFIIWIRILVELCITPFRNGPYTNSSNGLKKEL